MRLNLIYQNFRQALRWGFVICTVALLVFITMQSLGPAQGSININHADKYAHALAYCCLGLAALPAFPRIWPVIIWVTLTMYGILIEVLQGAMGMGRKADILDALANSSGALLAILLWMLVSYAFTTRNS